MQIASLHDGFGYGSTDTDGSSGKYRTLTEQRVAQAGGRIADDKTVCVCISWDANDLDLHCKIPSGEVNGACTEHTNTLNRHKLGHAPYEHMVNPPSR